MRTHITKRWMPGEAVALRGIYNGRVWYMQSALVVHDSREEVALAVLPGAECSAPREYIHGKHGDSGNMIAGGIIWETTGTWKLTCGARIYF